MDSLRDTNFFGKTASVCVRAPEGPNGEDLIYLRLCLVKGGKKRRLEKRSSGNRAVEQRTLVRHRLTFHRNPLASSAGGRVSRPRLRCLMGPVAIRQQCDGNVAFSRAESGRRIHPSRRVQRACARGRSTSRRHRHADLRASAPFPSPLFSSPERRSAPPSTRGACAANSATCGAPPPKCRRRLEYAAARNANGNYSGRESYFRRVTRLVGTFGRARAPIISSSVLAFSRGPSFSLIRSLPSPFLHSSPSFLFVGLFHAPRV